MTDYEAKFHAEGLPIHRCVGTKGPYTPPGPSDEDTAEQTETSE